MCAQLVRDAASNNMGFRGVLKETSVTPQIRVTEKHELSPDIEHFLADSEDRPSIEADYDEPQHLHLILAAQSRSELHSASKKGKWRRTGSPIYSFSNVCFSAVAIAVREMRSLRRPAALRQYGELFVRCPSVFLRVGRPARYKRSRRTGGLRARAAHTSSNCSSEDAKRASCGGVAAALSSANGSTTRSLRCGSLSSFGGFRI